MLNKMKNFLTLVALCICLGLPSIMAYYDYQEEPTSSNGYLGCFNNNVGGVRIMTEKLSGNDYDVDSCRDAASPMDGIVVFGLQNGGECWVSSNSYNYKLQGESLFCNLPCATSLSTFCGGYNSMQVYATLSKFNWNAIAVHDVYPFFGYEPWSGYIGCFNNWVNGVQGLGLYIGTETYQSCRWKVLKKDNNTYKYIAFGLDQGGDCWTDTKENMKFYQQGKSTSCNKVCEKDKESFCGGYNALQVYATRPGMNIGIPRNEPPRNAPVPTRGFIGCYNDSPDNRRLSKLVGAHYSTEKCYQAVSDLGSAYNMFALQDGHECWGGTPSDDYSGLGIATCSKLCEYGVGVFCGGKNINQVYTLVGYRSWRN